MAQSMSSPLAAGLIGAALVAIGLGCGSQEAPDPAATTLGESKSAPDRPIPPHGKAYVDYSDGRVTVRSEGSLQLAVLEQLAAQAGFEIIAGRTEARPITLDIERAPLIDAIALILDGVSYTLGYEFDEASETRMLARVEIGETLENSAANLAKTEPSNAQRIRDHVPSAAQQSAVRVRSDRGGTVSKADAAEQAEMLAKLDSPDPETRADAADWIDLDKEALERMVSMLESDPDVEVRLTIVERLGDAESPGAIAALIVALRDPDSEVVLEALEILEFEGDTWLIPELEQHLAHPDPEVREAIEDAIDYLE